MSTGPAVAEAPTARRGASRPEPDQRPVAPRRAVELTPDETAAFWPRILARNPGYERYRRATDRAIPLVRLLPVAVST